MNVTSRGLQLAAAPVAAAGHIGYHLTMTRGSLPPWVEDNRTAVAREAAPYRELTTAERTRLLAAACRAAARQLASRPDRQRLLDYRDPLPPSTIETLRRLRAAARDFT